jgi:hypothetical protein
MPFTTTDNFYADDYGFAPPTFGGAVACKIGTFAFTDTTAKTLFTLPAYARIVDVIIQINTAFDAGSSNTFDLGITGDGDAIADGAAAGTAAILRAGSTNVSGYLNTELPDVDVTAVYIPTGTAATAGLATVIVFYVVL